MRIIKVFGALALAFIIAGCSPSAFQPGIQVEKNAYSDELTTQPAEQLPGENNNSKNQKNTNTNTNTDHSFPLSELYQHFLKETSPIGEWVELEIVLEKAEYLQELVDDGHRVGMMDPVQVAADFVCRDLELPMKHGGFIKNIDLENYPIKDAGNAKIVEFEFNDGCRVELRLIQPVREKRGIWVVEAYRITN